MRGLKEILSQMWSFWSGIFLFVVVLTLGLCIIAHQFVCHTFGLKCAEYDDIAW